MYYKLKIEELIEKIENNANNGKVVDLDFEFFIKNRVIPIDIGDDSIFCLSIHKDYNTLSNIEYITKKFCHMEEVDEKTFDKLFKKYLHSIRYNNKSSKLQLFSVESKDDNKNIETINYLNSLIERGIRMDVSDIHIEPYKEAIRVRFRIDGKLITQKFLNKNLYSIIITRIKILGKLDISERRLPQDGRITFQYENRDIDLRISTIPTIYGEKIAIRILDSEFKFSNLESLGIDSIDLEVIKRETEKLNGMILVCGPTGSGKTTTIYSILNRINSEELNIVTMEDPVEYKIDGINQIQINYKTGLEFVNTLNHILRQDPDIISIGELRNEETVKTALRASITGHFVFSTIHTGDSISAIYRLKDMQGESYLISNALKLIISQKLVRKLCDQCKEEDYLDSSLFGGIKKVFKPKGCIHCNNGYSGRIGIFEVLEVDRDIKVLIENESTYDEILQAARKKGFKTLKEKLIDSVLEGTTSLEEVIKII